MHDNDSLRETVEQSSATHLPSPDRIQFENRVADLKGIESRALKENPTKWEDFHPHDRRRLAVRLAYAEVENKAAAKAKGLNNGPEPQRGTDAPLTAPKHWDKEAALEFEQAPLAVRQAVRRSDKLINDSMPTIQNVANKAQGIVSAIDKYRHNIPAGTQDHEAVDRLFMWENYIRQNPRMALQEIANQYGVDLSASYNPGYQQQPAQSAQEAQIAQHLAAFAVNKPHFERVRHTMGLILANNESEYLRTDGTTDLDKLYVKACAIEGLGVKDHVQRAEKLAVSPSTRAPSAANTYVAPEGPGVRNSIRAAMREVRGGRI
jgi:hypothetical protein